MYCTYGPLGAGIDGDREGKAKQRTLFGGILRSGAETAFKSEASVSRPLAQSVWWPFICERRLRPCLDQRPMHHRRHMSSWRGATCSPTSFSYYHIITCCTCTASFQKSWHKPILQFTVLQLTGICTPIYCKGHQYAQYTCFKKVWLGSTSTSCGTRESNQHSVDHQCHLVNPA